MPRFVLGMISISRLLRFAAAAALCTTFAACGGANGGLTPSVPDTSRNVTTDATATATTNALTVSGSVVSADVSKFTVKTTNPSCGTMYVYYSKTATKFYPYLGYPVTAGMPIQATGSGTCANGASLQASTVTYTAAATPPPAPTASPAATATPAPAATSAGLTSASSTAAAFTVSGNVSSADSAKFTVKTANPSCGTMYVYYSKATTTFYPYLGYPVTAGMPIQATGSGTCANGGSMQATIVTYTAAATPPPSSTVAATATPAPAPTPIATAAPTNAPATAPYGAPATTSFMPSSWGKISAFQVFDETGNGYITQTAASQDGYRYSAVWGSRWNIGTSWNNSNGALETSYYNALETDPSYTGWGAIGHDLTWWNANHPDWVLYACTSANAPTTNPAYVPGLNTNIPLDIHNPAVVDYQVRAMANYAHRIGYHALAIDEATFWQADMGAGSGSFGCGIYQNGSFVRRYSGVNDANWAADVVAWVKQAHAILTTDPTISAYHLKLIVNHPAGALTANETALLANVDADLDETGYSSYGHYQTSNTWAFTTRTNWAMYAQQHGTAVLMNANWGSLSVTTPLLDYSVATYLMGNLQAESLFASPASGYGLEQWHSQYQTAVGAPCGAYYGGSAYDSANPAIYYRKFANALVVVNGGSGSSAQVAHLPAGHAYTDLLGRPVSNPLTVGSNDGYVLLTGNGCQ